MPNKISQGDNSRKHQHADGTQPPLFSLEGEWDWITGGDDDE